MVLVKTLASAKVVTAVEGEGPELGRDAGPPLGGVEVAPPETTRPETSDTVV